MSDKHQRENNGGNSSIMRLGREECYDDSPGCPAAVVQPGVVEEAVRGGGGGGDGGSAYCTTNKPNDLEEGILMPPTVVETSNELEKVLMSKVAAHTPYDPGQPLREEASVQKTKKEKDVIKKKNEGVATEKEESATVAGTTCTTNATTYALTQEQNHNEAGGGRGAGAGDDVDVDDDVLGDIQPLPLQRSSHSNGGTPGAYRVNGLPRCYHPSPPRSSSMPDTSATTTATATSSSSSNNMSLQGFLVESGEFRNVEDGEEEATGVSSSGFDGDFSHLEEAQQVTPLPDKTHKKEAAATCRNKPYLFLIVLVAVVGLVTVIIWSSMQSSSNNDAGGGGGAAPEATGLEAAEEDVVTNSTKQEEETSFTSIVPFQDDLPSYTLKGINEDPNSPHARANEWMWNDPYLRDYSKQRQRQRFGLVVLFFSTGGENWSNKDNWLDYEVSECSWFSKATTSATTMEADEDQLPVCDDQEKFLTLDLHSNNLNGTLPRDMWFTKPRHLNLADNYLRGAFPPFPSESEQLEVVIISNNNFTGRMTGEAGLFVGNLRIIKLDGNSLQGGSESDSRLYAGLPKLEVLNLTSNRYQHPVSTWLKYLTELKYLGVGHNKKNGPLPTEIGMLRNLEVLDFSFNSMVNGSIPSELGLLTNLVHFDMDGTQIQGALPDEFCNREHQNLLRIDVNCTSVQCCSNA